MSANLENILAMSGQPALAELRLALHQVLNGEATSIAGVEEHTLKSRVYRLRFHGGGVTHTVVAKRLETGVASRCELLARRWLPAEGLASAAPRLIAASEAADGWVWHVYEDLGQDTLERRPDGERVEAAVQLIARLHTRFASHALLDECRAATQDLGIDYFTTNVRIAIQALEALRGHAAMQAGEPQALRGRLLTRLTRLDAEVPARARSLADAGSPATLLHGDPWTSNVFVTPTANGLEARLLDWDRVGVGPASYDLSTFLLRFPPERRACILDHYDRAVAAEGGRPLDRRPAARNFETAELARYANRVIWPARAIAEGNRDWGLSELAEVERWFESLRPVLEMPTTAAPVAARRARATLGTELPAGARLLIVNADDFGATSGVNRGILEAHARGIVTSASLMVDAPAAREAAEARRKAPTLGIGLHVDLGRTPPADAAGIRELLLRQAEQFEWLMGRKPTHLDSHRNSHLDPLALPEFMELARRWRIPLRGHSPVRLLPSFYGQWNGESHPEQVGVLSLLRLLATRVEPGITELICHPAYVDASLASSYRLEREVERATLCDAEVSRALPALGIQLVGFADVRGLVED
jgi:predicted glycoside hydrolase/deacetylase ChbG (UPF0249 family)